MQVIMGDVMLRWMLLLAAICATSAVLGLGWVVNLTSTCQGLCFTLTALSATLLIGSFDAFETEAVRVDRDDD